MTKTNKSTELTPPAFNKNLLDGAVDFINRATHASGVQLAITISEYIVDTFFGGDAAALTSKDSNKTASFRALCDRQDLNMSAATLNRLVRVGQQARNLPSDLSESLSQSQHRALLAEPDARQKAHLARQAVKHSWTAEKLTAEIAAAHPHEPTRAGRPPKAAVRKWLDALNKSAGDQFDLPTFGQNLAKLTADEQNQMRAEVAAIQQKLAAVLAILV